MKNLNKIIIKISVITTLILAGTQVSNLSAANQYISEQGIINALNNVKAGHTSLVSLDQTHVANACEAARNNQHTDFSWAGSEIIAHSSTSVYDTPAENLVNIGWMDEESRGLEPGHKNAILGIYNDGSGETYRATKASVCIVDGANGGSGVGVEFFDMEDNENKTPIENIIEKESTVQEPQQPQVQPQVQIKQNIQEEPKQQSLQQPNQENKQETQQISKPINKEIKNDSNDLSKIKRVKEKKSKTVIFIIKIVLIITFLIYLVLKIKVPKKD